MWKKLGLIFEPGLHEQMTSHAQNPLPEHLGGSIYRVHVASRDKANQARGWYFDIDMESFKVVNVPSSPLLDLGLLGAFDDSGVMPSAIVDVGNKKYMYTTGWSKAVTVPFSFHIGLFISDDGGNTYKRYSDAPVLGRNHHDPYITGAPYVLKEGDKFKMWYISATAWIKETPDAKPKHYYTVKYAESNDGINWITSDHICINYNKNEYAIARPVVYKEGEVYKMWFSYRGGNDTYRIGAASSKDGINWQREKEVVDIPVSTSGWDSEMVCYAHPLFYKNKTYALYNGNSYGATGVGIAVKEI
jgi:hypothetical protein